AKLWLLSVLLFITIAASSWPTGTSAAPRIASGKDLIWPHRDSSTKPAAVTAKAPSAPLAPKATAARPHHRRLKAKRLHRLFVREAHEKPSVLITNQTATLKSCKAMEAKEKKVIKLEKALKKAQNYKDTVICITEDYVSRSDRILDLNIRAENKTNLYQSLDLDHPLKHQAKKVTYSPEGKFEYEGPIGKLEEEMPKIIESLLILEALMNTIKYGEGQFQCTFKYIREAVQSNTASAMDMMIDQQCNPQKEIHYHKGVVSLPFHVAMETIKVLTVIEYTYEQLLKA
ncbi:hypothetical protein KR032_010917, partial [Drosophila birchii]